VLGINLPHETDYDIIVSRAKSFKSSYLRERSKSIIIPNKDLAPVKRHRFKSFRTFDDSMESLVQKLKLGSTQELVLTGVISTSTLIIISSLLLKFRVLIPMGMPLHSM
jgi:hypothetical protein